MSIKHFSRQEDGSSFAFTNIPDNFSSLDENSIYRSTEAPELTGSNPSNLYKARGILYEIHEQHSCTTTEEDNCRSSPVSIPVIKINMPSESVASHCDNETGDEGLNF